MLNRPELIASRSSGPFAADQILPADCFLSAALDGSRIIEGDAGSHLLLQAELSLWQVLAVGERGIDLEL